jgi:hypothetical protein
MATRKRVIPRTKDLVDVAPAVEEYLLNRSMRERSEFHEGRLKKDLLSLLEEIGELVATHKQVLELDAPLPYVQYKAGKPVQKKVIGIERRERVSVRLDEDKTLKLLGRKGLTDTCTTTVVVVDEDAILAANYSGKITDKELAALYTESITAAFYLQEES